MSALKEGMMTGQDDSGIPDEQRVLNEGVARARGGAFFFLHFF